MACAAPAVAVDAAEFSDTYVEGGLNYLEDSYGSSSGWAVRGSAALGNNVHALGSYSEIDEGGFGHSMITRLGLGWSTDVLDASGVVVRASYVGVDDGGVFGSRAIDGWELEGGLRTAFGDRVETYVAVGYLDLLTTGYVDVTEGSGDYYARLEAFYKFSPWFGMVAKAQVADGGGEYLVGPRISF